MRTLARLVLFVLAVPAMSGCLTSESLIRLNADGSGTIESVTLVNESAMEEMAGMFGGGKVSSTSTSPFSFDEAELRAQAGKLGRGVRFVSSEPVERGGMKGARAVYAFDDVNALRIAQDPLSGASGADGATPPSPPLDMRLSRLAGGNALLTIEIEDRTTSTPAKKSTAPKAGKGSVPPELQEMITALFEGFRVAIDVEVNGALVRTSSPFVTGSRVTVLELDLGTLMKDPANVKRLADVEPGAGISDLLPVLKDVTGIKINQSPLTIEFAAR